jgi:hypothetical protein
MFALTYGDHFYTTSIAESNNAVAQDGYHFEGTACYVYDSQQPGTVPFFRLLNNSDGDHFYTASPAERDNAVAQDGYHFEGTACYVYDSQQPGTVPFFRLLKDPPSQLDESEFMGPGLRIVSPNGTCWATLNSTPDYFYVYRGRYPDNSGGVIWSLPTPVVGGGGTTDGTYPALFLVMQSDGNLVLYSGGPKNVAVWASNTVRNEAPHRYTASLLDSGQVALTNRALSAIPYWTSQVDPVVDFEIASIEYHLDQAQITAVDDEAAWTEELNNDTGIQQSISYTHTATTTNTSGWQDSLAIHVGVSTTFEVQVPVAGAKVTLSADVTTTFTWNGSTSYTTTDTVTEPIIEAPHTDYVVQGIFIHTTLSVPYTMYGNFVYKSGHKATGTIDGIYTGVNAHDLHVDVTDHPSVAG